GPDLFPLVIFVDSQPADDHDRHRIGHVAPDTAWSSSMRYGANRQDVVADHMRSGADHVGARSAAFFILQRTATQPVVERRLSAGELREIVVRTQLLGRAQRWVAPGHCYCSQGAFVFSSRRSLALLTGGLSNMDVNRLNSSLDKAKYRRSSRTASASRQAVSSMKSERFRPSASAARSMSVFWRRLARRLMFSSRVFLVFVPVAGIRRLPCIHNDYTSPCARCKYRIHFWLTPSLA